MALSLQVMISHPDETYMGMRNTAERAWPYPYGNYVPVRKKRTWGCAIRRKGHDPIPTAIMFPFGRNVHGDA